MLKVCATVRHIEYMPTTELRSFTEAESYCISVLPGSTLALPQNQNENDCLRSFYPATNLWIGAYGKFQSTPWRDNEGQNISWTNFAGQPGTNRAKSAYCLAMLSQNSGKWSDHHCDTRYTVFCQRGKA